MPQRLIKENILVVRNGKRVKPEIGKAFDLTADEIRQLESVRPQAIDKIASVQEDPQSIQTDTAGDDAGLKDPVDLADMERDQLIQIATDMELTFAKNISKAKLVELIESASEPAGDDDGDL